MISVALPISFHFISRSDNYLLACVHVASFATTQSNEFSMKILFISRNSVVQILYCHTINTHRCVCIVSAAEPVFFVSSHQTHKSCESLPRTGDRNEHGDENVSGSHGKEKIYLKTQSRECKRFLFYVRLRIRREKFNEPDTTLFSALFARVVRRGPIR